MSDAPVDFTRRFGGVQRLYGNKALERFRSAHVCIVGIGGVGSWVAEALARSAIGQLTLIDLDMVAESNVNRQVHALEDTLGMAKTDAMAERIRRINPECLVRCIEDFVTRENLQLMLGSNYDFIVDAIDQVRTKVAMIAWCKIHAVPVLTIGGAGGQTDPSRIEISDLARTIQDPLLSKVRASLRREHGFSRDPKKKFNVPAIFSNEPVRYPERQNHCDAGPALSGLNCAGYGSSVCVTATFGLFAASEVLRRIADADQV